MKNIYKFLLLAFVVCAVSVGSGASVHAEEYEEYGYQFSPGYYDAMQQDPTFGGRQGEVGEVAEPPAPTAPEEGSTSYNYSYNEECYYDYCSCYWWY